MQKCFFFLIHMMVSEIIDKCGRKNFNKSVNECICFQLGIVFITFHRCFLGNLPSGVLCVFSLPIHHLCIKRNTIENEQNGLFCNVHVILNWHLPLLHRFPIHNRPRSVSRTSYYMHHLFLDAVAESSRRAIMQSIFYVLGIVILDISLCYMSTY